MKSSIMQTETPAWHDKEFSSYALACRCWRKWKIALKLTDTSKNSPWHTQMKISSVELKPPVCQDTSPCTSSCFGAPARGRVTSPWCWHERWLQMHWELPSPGHLCQERWWHQTLTPAQGSSRVHSSWWRSTRQNTDGWVSLLPGLLHPHWNPTGFIYLLFRWPLLDQHQKPSFFPQPSYIDPFCHTPAV